MCLLSFVAAGQSLTAGLSRDQVLSSIRTGNLDAIKTTLNQIKGMAYPQDILPVMQDIWDGKSDQYPDLPWRVLKSDIVRTEVADILLQAHYNGLIKINVASIREYLLKEIRNSDSETARTALLALAPLDDAADVPALVDIAKQFDPHTYRAAVITLARMCNPKASEGLKTVLNASPSSDVRKGIEDVMRHADAAKSTANICGHRG
jgi:hypothetical protein